MLPRLYTANVKTNHYNNNGLGFLTACTKCEVTEERNGNYTLKAVVKKCDRLAKNISVGKLIKAKANSKDPPQLFYITKTEIDKNGDITISANHIKYLFYQNGTVPHLANPMVIYNGTPKQIMDELLCDAWFDNIFTFKSNISAARDFSLGFNSAEKFGKVFGDEENGIITTFGGELHFDNFNIELLKSRGKNSGARIMYGKNVSDFKQTISNENVYTHIMAFAKVKTVDGNEIVVSLATPFSTGVNRPFKNVYVLDCTSKTETLKNTSVNPTTGLHYDEIRRELTSQVALYQYQNPDMTEAVNIEVTYQSELDKLQDVSLCDTVKVITNDAALTSKITKTVYDSLSEKYTTIGIGDLKTTLTDFVRAQRRFKRYGY